ncbi:MAG: hypothetical protein NXH85_14230 [Pseudomonadaceae bacterium]|nr:hypothetical protein [Pseudomonadaceae bacterium]
MTDQYDSAAQPGDGEDSRADAIAIGMIFSALVGIAVFYISGWTPFI